MPGPERVSRFAGALLGLAVGDAIGTSVEFRQRESFQPVTDMVGGGIFRLQAGEWTDDTSMALCLAESLLLCERFDPLDQMHRYCRWWRDGYLSSNGRCFDIGSTTRRALSRFEVTDDPFAGSTDPSAAGNGSLMRLAPVPLFFADSYAHAILYSGESSRTTHAAKTAVDSCRYFGGLIAGAVQGNTKQELFSTQFLEQCGLDVADLDEAVASIAGGSFKKKSRDEIGSSGYVIDTLEAALWAIWSTDNYRDGVLAAVNLGNDADTTGAVYGQLAGALYGLEDIPVAWLERLKKRELIEDFARRLSSARSR